MMRCLAHMHLSTVILDDDKMKIGLVRPISLRSFEGTKREFVGTAELLAQRGNEVYVHALPYTCTGYKAKGASVISTFERLNIEYEEKTQHKLLGDVAHTGYAPFILNEFGLSCPAVVGLHYPLLFASKSALEEFINPMLGLKHYKSPRYIAGLGLSDMTKNFGMVKFSAVRLLRELFNVRHRMSIASKIGPTLTCLGRSQRRATSLLFFSLGGVVERRGLTCS